MCEKCDTNAAAIEHMRTGLGGEVWSGMIGGVKRWFNIGRAKQALATVPRGLLAQWIREVDVEAVWAAQIHSSYIVWEHLPHVNMDEPVIIGVVDVGGPDLLASVMDGIHRVARAHQEGRKTIYGLQLSAAFTKDIEIPAEFAVMDELLNEILATGGRVEMHGETLVIIGGKPAPQGPDHHPLRAGMVAAIMAGPAVLKLPELP